jgi:hypothetical protein
MAQIVEIDDAEHRPGLYDSANGVSLVAERVVDITEDCPSGERTVLLYTTAKRGPIVQIAHPYENQKYMGSHIHFFINELDDEPDARGDSFSFTARRTGLSRLAFRQLIEANAPARLESRNKAIGE